MKITAAIVIIGDEILLGRVQDTNSGFIARALDREGIRVVSVSTTGDNGADIKRAIDNAMAIADVVITTGGLGPTRDDITKRVLLDRFGGTPVRDADVTAHLHRWAEARGMKLNDLTLDQALVPSSARVMVNRAGSAPIMFFTDGSGKTVVSMPGVPFETETMLPDVIATLLADRRAEGKRHSTFILSGITESDLAIRLADFEDSLPEGFSLAYLPDSPVIRLRLDGPDDHRFDAFDNTLEERVADLLLGAGEKSLGQLVVDALAKRGLTLSTAESCTGGNIARMITSVPGSSEVFNGGVVSYANSTKTDVLGVMPETLAVHGAVSEPTVRQMVEGATRVLHTDCAVATSGIAGPGGATPDKPVGTVWIAVNTPRAATAAVYRFPGTRDRVIARASATALINLLRQL